MHDEQAPPEEQAVTLEGRGHVLPTPGRIVLIIKKNEHLPAIVTKVWSDTGLINVTMFTNNGGAPVQLLTSINHESFSNDGVVRWVWPPRN